MTSCVIPSDVNPKCSLKLWYRLIILLLLPGLEGLPDEKKQAIKEVVPLDVVPHEVVLDYTYWPVGKSGTYTYALKELHF